MQGSVWLVLFLVSGTWLVRLVRRLWATRDGQDEPLDDAPTETAAATTKGRVR